MEIRYGGSRVYAITPACSLHAARKARRPALYRLTCPQRVPSISLTSDSHFALPHRPRRSMTFPATSADADPDPTTQIAWPSRNGKRRGPEPEQVASPEDGQSSTASVSGKRARTPERDGDGDRRMSTLDLMKLSVSMGGSQVAWTVELG